MFPKLTPVVQNLLIVNVIVFFGATSLSNIVPSLAMHFPMSEGFKPYQVVTHFFMHGDIQHLIYNMLGLFFLGPLVEQRIGSKNFLIFYLLCAVGAILAHFGIDFYEYLQTGRTAFAPVVGASGAIYGVVIAFATLFPNQRLMLLFPPIPVKAKYLAVAYIAFDLYNGVMGSATGIAHFAHLGGALAGFLLIKFYFESAKRV